MNPRSTGLWGHADYLRFWAGHTLSMFGGSITMMAIPLTAISILEATPAQMGVLEAAAALPSLLLGLFAGAWVDRRRRRPLLIAADVGQAALLILIPAAAMLSVLRIEYLWIVAFILSALGLLFGIANGPYLLSLVGRERIVEANGKIEASRSAADILGSGLAGWLVGLVSAPVAVALDTLSHLARALLLARIRTPEPTPQRVALRPNVWREISEGLGLVARSRMLRAIAGCVGTISLFNAMLEAVWMLYLTRELGIEPGLLGLIYATGSVGFLVGALLPGQATRRLGFGPAIIGGVLMAALSDLLTPLAGGPFAVVVIVLITAQFSFGLGLTVYNVGQMSLRQAVTPDHLQGRVDATMRVLSSGVVLLGALLGGALGEIIGLRATLFVAAVGEIFSVAWLALSPLRSLREQPAATG